MPRESSFEFLSQLLDILQGVACHIFFQQQVLNRVSDPGLVTGWLTGLNAVMMQSTTQQCGKGYLLPER